MAGADFGVEETFDLAFGVVVVDLDFAISSRTNDTCLGIHPRQCRGELQSRYSDTPLVFKSIAVCC